MSAALRLHDPDRKAREPRPPKGDEPLVITREEQAILAICRMLGLSVAQASERLCSPPAPF